MGPSRAVSFLPVWLGIPVAVFASPGFQRHLAGLPRGGRILLVLSASRSSSASSSPLGGLQFLAHVATTNGASGCSVLFLYCYDLRTAVPFFTSRAFIVSAAKERLGLRAVTALVTWSPPPYFWEGEGRGCQGTSCLLSLLPFRLLPLVLPRLPVAVRRRRDWRRGGRNYRREWRTAAINPRRQVFRG